MLYKIVKRVFDFICALIGIVGTSPLWIIGVVGILLSDWGPVFYIATRIGKNNKPFKMYKFRSMRVAKAATEVSLRPDEDRIFPFGHFIRKVKIDELPQLLNILNGTMSVSYTHLDVYKRQPIKTSVSNGGILHLFLM